MRDTLFTWCVKFAAIMVVFFVIGLLLMALVRKAARRTLEHWHGRGVRGDLAPAQVAVLIGLHPGLIFRLLLHEMDVAGTAALLSFDPFRVQWTGRMPRDEVEEAMRSAPDLAGHVVLDRALPVLEALWRQVDATMEGSNGRKTALHYRRMLDEMWVAAARGGDLPAGVEDWLVMAEWNGVRDRVGQGPGWDRLRELYRSAERLRHEVFPEREMSERANRAREGFLLYRQDLVFLDRKYEGPPEWAA